MIINTFYNKHDDFDKYIRWDMLRKTGIHPYPELNIYVNNQYGAWMGNINGNINNDYELSNLSCLDFDTYISTPLSKYIDAGYELVIGPAVPETDGKMHGIGIYCKNWQEIISKSSLNMQKSIKY